MRTVSGIQPTGNLHLGNYLGAIKNWVKLQEQSECLFFLADLHAITVYNDPAELSANCREMVAALVAAGVDPEKSILFNQARVPQHAELAWLLICNTPMGWLDRMTQFKEKSGKHKQRSSLGLYGYPVLQAADVLIYQATHVPVGEDQKQHLELARDIAAKFNNDTGKDVFTPPEPFIGETAARVMSLRDGNAKMSKSDPSDLSRINMTDDDDTIAKKVRKARTDPEPLPETLDELDGRSEASNLVGIYAALADSSGEKVLAEFAGKGFGDFKPALADLAVSKLAPIRDRFDALRQDPSAIDAILRDGAERARTLAQPTTDAAYAALGLLRD
ncbi:tryptophanyl-tRNA synthetase [Parasphingorhabdus marina DSM 22363]|uniref:Tryptophan--tRNA ligase n=1 Tax=Parasphingorhabdus marina DSM 22363 TaxID=1123272 RepID=A0A1N6CN06_9SPHN|nr:tryptophan--tRNA ligase [Parasphingorhabdus marina]SIN59950.1 tryptophanyl-tRNA synthetase [Parasphingorhabdus marina DSM 22363]